MNMEFEIINGQYNIGYYCSRFQCLNGNAGKTALRWIDASGAVSDYNFSMLDAESDRVAWALTRLGISRQDIVFTFLPRMPEQFFAFLGILKMQAVAGTLFSNFGEEALADRLGDSRAVAVITRRSLSRKIERVRDRLPRLRYVLLTDVEDHLSDTVLSLPKLLKPETSVFDIPLTSPETPSVLHYTSGSTGKPKGVQHLHRSILSQAYTTRHILGLQPNDIYWCTADQGWVTGTSYGIIGPWSLGVTQIHFGGNYDASRWFEILESEKVSVWYTAPTALRMLMREDKNLYSRFNLNELRDIFSVGEPLNPEVIYWGREVLNHDIYDTWFQTETGSIMISNRPGLPIRPGSMGKPSGMVSAAILGDNAAELPDKQTGHLCVKAGWDSMFAEYLNNPEVYDRKFKAGYYYSGDLAYRDEDGYYWFVGRNDDVINTAGHLISPFEIESALLEIPEVAESAVIGAPDDILFEKVVAFIRLKAAYLWEEDLEMKIRLFLSNRLSSIATPQDMIVVKEIPKNKSGKIMRRVLKAQYLGQDPGDISTLDI